MFYEDYTEVSSNGTGRRVGGKKGVSREIMGLMAWWGASSKWIWEIEPSFFIR